MEVSKSISIRTNNRVYDSYQTTGPVSSKQRNFIRKAFYMAAYVFPDDIHNTKIRNILRISIEYTITLALFMYTIGDLRGILITQIRYMPIGLTFSALFRNFFSVFARLVLIMKRKDIFNAMVYLQDISEETSCKQKWYLVAGFASCFVLPMVSFTYVLTDLCLPGSERNLKDFVKYNFFGWYLESDKLNCLLVILLDVITANQEFLLSGFGVVLCWYLFGLLRQLIKSFTRTSLNDQDAKSLYESFVRYSQTVLQCVEHVEKAMSLFLLVMYGYMTFSIFSVTTFLVRSRLSKMKALTLIPQLLVATMMLLAFYVTSSRAIAVHEEALKVKNLTYKRICKLESAGDDYKPLLMVMVDDFPSKVVVNVFGMFKFERGFTLQTASVIITYGTLLSQLGKVNSKAG